VLSPRTEKKLSENSDETRRSLLLQSSPLSLSSKSKLSGAFSKVVSPKQETEKTDTEMNVKDVPVSFLPETVNEKDEFADYRHTPRAESPTDLPILRGEEDSIGEDSVEPLLRESVKVNAKTVLESVVEDSDETIQQEHIALQNKFKGIMIEKQELQNRLSNIRKSYEERVTPFRDVFDDKRQLEKQLKAAAAIIHAQNKQKEEVDTMVEKLQQQMVTALQGAVQNATQLKLALAEAKSKIHVLEQASS